MITRVLCDAILITGMQASALATHTTNQNQPLKLLEGQKQPERKFHRTGLFLQPEKWKLCSNPQAEECGDISSKGSSKK